MQIAINQLLKSLVLLGISLSLLAGPRVVLAEVVHSAPQPSGLMAKEAQDGNAAQASGEDHKPKGLVSPFKVTENFESQATASFLKEYSSEASKVIFAGGISKVFCKGGTILFNYLAGTPFALGINDNQELICTMISSGVVALASTPLVSKVMGGYWGWSKNSLGYYDPPAGLTLVKPWSATNPDGAIDHQSLIYDPSQLSSTKVKSSIEAMLKGDKLRNGIYYGDAGTGKSSSIRAFSHVKGFKVYSISGPDLHSVKDFLQLKQWLDNTATPTNKILIDVSEGDDILYKIAFDAKFQAYFKKNFETEHSSYAFIFSCNFNEKINYALKEIKNNEALSRRLPERIRFSAPSGAVRLALLKQSTQKHLAEYFSDDAAAVGYFEQLFKDRDFVANIINKSTEGYSHNLMLSLGKKFVYLYYQALAEEAAGIDGNFAEFAYLSETGLTIDAPLMKIKSYLLDNSDEDAWLLKENEKIIQQRIKDIDLELPLRRKEAELMKALREAKEKVPESQSSKSGGADNSLGANNNAFDDNDHFFMY